jgi:hypothetical protein
MNKLNDSELFAKVRFPGSLSRQTGMGGRREHVLNMKFGQIKSEPGGFSRVIF